jgi:DNA-binding PadR family transcriptional regulator
MKGVTPYQLELLKAARAAHDAGAPLDLDQLLDTLSWEPSKESLQFTIRALIKRGLIVKSDLELRRGRRRVSFLMTADGRQLLDPRPCVGSASAEPTTGQDESQSLLPEPVQEQDILVPGDELFE